MRRIAYASMGTFFWLAAGCGKPVNTKRSAELAAAAKAEQAEQAKANVPGGITGTGWHIPWRAKDPKHPNGPPVIVLIADARNGAMDSQDDDVYVRLWHVHAQLFRDRKPSATVDAAEMTTDQHSKVVIGTGGVTIHSLPGAAKPPHPQDAKGENWLPPNTTITADKMTWDTQTSKLIAIGHAHATQLAPGSHIPTETSGERLKFDMETGDLTN
jgi:hypothetical protein